MPEYLLLADKGYETFHLRGMEGIISSFMRLNYGRQYKIDVDRNQGLLRFHLRNPEDAALVEEKLRNQKSLKGLDFQIQPASE